MGVVAPDPGFIVRQQGTVVRRPRSWIARLCHWTPRVFSDKSVSETVATSQSKLEEEAMNKLPIHRSSQNIVALQQSFRQQSFRQQSFRSTAPASIRSMRRKTTADTLNCSFQIKSPTSMADSNSAEFERDKPNAVYLSARHPHVTSFRNEAQRSFRRISGQVLADRSDSGEGKFHTMSKYHSRKLRPSQSDAVYHEETRMLELLIANKDTEMHQAASDPSIAEMGPRSPLPSSEDTLS